MMYLLLEAHSITCDVLCLSKFSAESDQDSRPNYQFTGNARNKRNKEHIKPYCREATSKFQTIRTPHNKPTNFFYKIIIIIVIIGKKKKGKQRGESIGLRDILTSYNNKFFWIIHEGAAGRGGKKSRGEENRGKEMTCLSYFQVTCPLKKDCLFNKISLLID